MGASGGGLGEELANVFEGSEEDGGSGARSAREGRLINQFDAIDFFDPGNFGGCGFFIGGDAEVAGEIMIDDGVGERGLSGAGNSGEAGEDAEGEIEGEVVDIIDAGAANFEVSFGSTKSFWDGNLVGALEVWKGFREGVFF